MAINFRSSQLLLIVVELLLIGILSSCTHAPINISDLSSLESNDALILTKVRTNVRDSEAVFYEKYSRLKAGSFGAIEPHEDMRVVKFADGEYLLGRINSKTGFIWTRCDSFRVKAAVLYYIGDLVVEWKSKDGFIVAHTVVIDRESKTVTEAKKLYPELFRQYRYEKALLKCK